MEHHGALVGWTHNDLGDKTLLCLESVQSSAAAHKHEPDRYRLVMTRSQAAVLGTYLLRISGHQPPPEPSWFRRLFG